MKVVFDLSIQELGALKEMVATYLDDTGYSEKYMPEWRPAYSPDVLASLREKVIVTDAYFAAVTEREKNK